MTGQCPDTVDSIKTIPAGTQRFLSHHSRGLSKGKAQRCLLRTSPSAMRKSVLSQVKKEAGDHPVCRELATENRGNLFFKRSDTLTKQDIAPGGVRGINRRQALKAKEQRSFSILKREKVKNANPCYKAVTTFVRSQKKQIKTI